MILSNNEQNIQTNVQNASKEFTIKTTAKAFRILSSGLYSDRIKAIIRELSCNAIDAHVMANNNEPFLVHLPSSLEPWFSVRDYGIGLSEDDIMNLYSTYFESTKTNSNDQIGALGLGSKSPFSYTDSFNVTSVWGGMSKSYTAFIDKNGTPSIVKVHEEESGEHNGIEVKFAVDKNDMDDFARKAGVVFRIFKNKPKVVGNTRYTQYEQTLTEVLAGNGWHFYKTDFYTPERAVALQGNIEYPIDKNLLGNLDDNQGFIADGKFYIDFKIGDLDIAASREGLGYDEQTIKNIKDALTKVYSEFITKLEETISKAPTMWQAWITASKLVDDLGFNYYRKNNMVFNWKKKKINLGEKFSYKFSDSPIKDDDGITKSQILDSKLRIIVYSRENTYGIPRVKKLDEYAASQTSKVEINVTPGNNSIFIVCDEQELTQTKLIRKARQVAIKNAGKRIYLLNYMSKKFFAAMGHPEYIFTSSIVLDKVSPSSPKCMDNYKLYDPKSGFATNFSYDELDENIVEDVDCYYVTALRDIFIDPAGIKERSSSDIINLFNFLKNKEIIKKDAILITVKRYETNLKRFKELEWIELTTFGVEKLKDYIEKNMDSIRESVVAVKKKNFIDSNINYHVREVLETEYKNHLSDYSDKSCFMNVAKMICEIKHNANKVDKDYRQYENTINIAQEYGINIEKTFNFDVNDINIHNAYPMLKFVGNWDFKEKFDKIKAYILMVDKLKEE